jgi:uncharacterized membrane protein
MLYALLKTLHLLCVILWVGGMLFAHFFLRPSLAELDAPVRLRLMHAVLGRFFNAVLVASSLVLASGVWMIGRTARHMVQSGASFSLPLEWLVMTVLGVLMLAIFGHLRFALYPRLSRAVAGQAWPAGAAALQSIRRWVMVNLGLGVVIVVVTLMGASS